MTDKFGMGTLGMGPLGGVMDSMEFIKQAWSTLNLPTNLAPTMDVEEMNRRIADLKVVEQWLTMNLAMLRSSIQGMEMQRDTISAMRAFGDAMSSSGEAGDAASRTIAAFGAMQRAATAAAGAAVAANPIGTPAPEDTSAPEPEPAVTHDASESPPGATAAPPRGPAESITEGLSRAAASPAAWWNLLQSQFNQVAQAALASAGMADAVRDDAGGAPGGVRKRKAGAGATPVRDGGSRRAAKAGGKRANARDAKAGSDTKAADATGAAGGRGRGKTAARGKAASRGAKGKR